MSILDIFRKSPPPVVRKPTCSDCELYRQSIKQATDAGNETLAEQLRQSFYTHCEIRHTRSKNDL